MNDFLNSGSLQRSAAILRGADCPDIRELVKIRAEIKKRDFFIKKSYV
jgi:hypothetical protein